MAAVSGEGAGPVGSARRRGRGRTRGGWRSGVPSHRRVVILGTFIIESTSRLERSRWDGRDQLPERMRPMDVERLKLPLLQRREIEARIVGPLIRAFAEEIGRERALEIV